MILARDGKPHAWGRTDHEGSVLITTGETPGTVSVSAPGRGSKTVSLAGDTPSSVSVELLEAGMVAARITDEQGEAIALQSAAFIGRDGTKNPDFGPDSGEHAVKNLYYSHDGRFRRELAPGSYDVIISHGPEYDAVFTRLVVNRGNETSLEGKLVRSVKTDGWISADFHSHSSPSGDNTSSQLGRVLNLLCEHIEFAPCTEHNRLRRMIPICTVPGGRKSGWPLVWGSS